MLRIVLTLITACFLLPATALGQTAAAAATPLSDKASADGLTAMDASRAPLFFGEAYRVGPGDVLSIVVWRDEALTRTLPVLPDGMLAFPLIGEIQAGGKTVADLTREMSARLTPFVPEPELSIAVQQVNSMMVYVIGRVNGPGRLALNGHLTALQALAMAGGPNPFAERNRIKIIREEPDQTLIFDFPYDDIIQGEHLEKNILLRRGDVIVVP